MAKISVKLSPVIFQVLCMLGVLDSVLCLNYECTAVDQDINRFGVANCSSQDLAHVPPNLPHNIKVLNLSNNIIPTLQDYSFVKYENLRKLYLTNISLTSIEADVFVRLERLTYLDLSFNNLGFVPSLALANMPQLKTLSLKGNKIQQLQANAFKFVPKLRALDLAGNHIQYVNPLAFMGLSSLQRLDLQNNALTTLNSSVFSHFTSEIREIKLYNNPWYCDCRLRWIIQWLQNASDVRNGKLPWTYDVDQPICHGPSILEQRPFVSLTTDLFLCPIRMYSNANNKLDLLEGDEVQLFCKYMADPYVPMTWLKDGKLLDLTQDDKYLKETHREGFMATSKLYIRKFKYEDIGKYECFAENKLGKAFDACLLGLQGVDISVPREATEDEDRDSVRNAVIALSTIGGVVFVLVLIGATIFALLKCKRYQKKKKESIRMSFEEHLKANGIIDQNPKDDPGLYDEPPDGSLSMDADMEDSESVYDSLQQPKNPSSVNTNTYISFKTEFSEPEDMTQLYNQGCQTMGNRNGSEAPTYSDAPTHSDCPYRSRSVDLGSRGDLGYSLGSTLDRLYSQDPQNSQCESTSPLLDNISPILIDPNDPFYEAHLYVPRLHSMTPQNYMPPSHHDFYDDDDNCSIPHEIRTLPHNGRVLHDDNGFIPQRTRTLPHGYSPRHVEEFGSVPVVRSNSVSAHHKSASVGHLGTSPPKKPPRMFHSRDTMSLHSQSSYGDRGENSNGGLRLSLPKPGSVDKYGTAV